MKKDPQNILGKISSFFINRYRVVYLIISTILLLGLSAYISLPREQMPEVSLPYVFVSVTYSGAAPQEMEALITDKIETKVQELDDIESLTSSSSNSIVSINIEFTGDSDIDEKINEVSNKISEIQNELPEDSTIPIISGFGTSDRPIMTINISGDTDLITLKNAAEDIEDEIKKVNGISDVTLVGGLDREVSVYVDPAKLAAYNLSVNQIKGAIANSNLNMPGGDIELDDMQFNIRTVAEFYAVNEIEQTIITTQEGSPIYLKDIAYVEDSYADITSYSQRYDAGVSEDNTVTPAVALTVNRKENADIVGASNAIKEVINNGKGTLYPEDLQITITNDQAIIVEDSLNDVIGNAISGLLIVIVVLFLFIGFRESIIVAFVIPLSLLSSFYLLNLNGMTLNTMSLVALILALGMLVDNAIVIMENIDRYRDDGMDVLRASKLATNQVAPAVMAATLTTLSAFFPIALTPGIMGDFIKVIPITVMFAIGSSFVISLVITPALCSRFLSKHKVKTELSKKRKIISVILVFVLALYAFSSNGSSGLLSWTAAILFASGMYVKQFKANNTTDKSGIVKSKYIVLLGKVLSSKKRKVSVIIISIMVLLVSLSTIPLGFLKIELMPETDSTEITISIETPYGYLLDDTGQIVSQVENILFTYPETKSFVSKVGNTGDRDAMGDSPNTAAITLEIVEKEQRDKSSLEIVEDLRADFKNIAGAEITVEQDVMGPSSGKPVQINLKGENLEELKMTANDFEDILNNISGTTEVSTSVSGGPPELQVVIDKEQASLLGLDTATISSEIRSAIQGVEASKYRENQEEIDIVIRTSKDRITTINDFNKIYFTSQTGNKIEFSQVASLFETKGLTAIEHDDLKRVVRVESNIQRGITSNEIITQFESELNNYSLPQGLEISYGGETMNITESFTSMAINMVLAIILVFIILSVQFNSLSQPLIILFSVPLAAIGAMFGLIFTGNNF
ncbi:MAG: efflux RND transporter permease subunit, partial [Clostridia bacterium]|nr:efflux RND transporter permease subunit [Clostridia bacterium]